MQPARPRAGTRPRPLRAHHCSSLRAGRPALVRDRDCLRDRELDLAPQSGSAVLGRTGSYTIAFNGETADVYVAPDEYEQYQFDAHPVAAPTASVYAGTNTWEWTDPCENHYTCSTKGTYGAVSTAPGALLAEIQMPPAAAGSLSFWATFASNADPPGMTSSVAWETTGVTPADDVYCEHPSFDSESDREYIEGGPVGFLSKADVAFTRSDQGVVRASGTVAGATDNTGTWTLGGHPFVSQDVTVTVDLQGYPPGVKPDEEEPPPPTPKDPVVLRLVASKFPPGNGSLKAGGARCRGGDLVQHHGRARHNRCASSPRPTRDR